MMPDPMQTVLDLLENNWSSSNTDSLTPVFAKVTDKKRVLFGRSGDWILAQVNRPLKEPAGIGTARKHQSDTFEIDVRVFGDGQESHFLNVVDEVERILDANIINPSTAYNILDSDGQQQNKSDGLRKAWRMLIPVKLWRYNRAR